MSVQQDAIAKALTFIANQQQSNGSFLSESSAERNNFTANFVYTTTFLNSLVLHALSQLNNSKADNICDTLAAYLRTQASPIGSYNYWGRESKEFKSMPYPDDSDDTFCALSALTAHSPSSIKGDTLAKATYILTLCESKPGGPYKTWITQRPEAEWHDIDIAVNSSILYFLKQHAIDQPILRDFLMRSIKNYAIYSPYYFSQYPVLYFLTRALGTDAQELAEFIARLRSVRPPASITEYALLANAYTHIGASSEAQKINNLLIGAQEFDGSWEAGAFGKDPKVEGRIYYWGSSALTTALCLEALSANRRLPKPVAKNIHEEYTQKTIHVALQQISTLDKTARTELEKQLHAFTKSSNAHEVTAAPFLFSQSIPGHIRTSQKTVQALSAANLYGWVAFTIYDDLIDEDGEPHLLSLANIAHRRSLFGFYTICKKSPDFQKYIEKTFDRIDASNAWESTYCRAPIRESTIYIDALPNYNRLTVLAEKSIGHALPFLALSVLSGNHVTSKHFTALEQSLIHYLIARQLHDDMHDWEIDLRNGHLSYVVTCLLKDRKIHGNHPTSSLFKEIQEHYWRNTLPYICTIVQENLTQARALLTSIDYNKTTLINLIERLEQGTTITLEKQKDTLLFLDTYAALTQNRY